MERFRSLCQRMASFFFGDARDGQGVDIRTNLRTLTEEVNSMDINSTWDSSFDRISVETLKFKFPKKVAQLPENAQLNRYPDVLPFDSTRVVIKKRTMNYINASLVKVPEADRQYILTQGPLRKSAAHFWTMVLEQNSRTIVMLSHLLTRYDSKCHKYFPFGADHGGGESMSFAEVGLKVDFVREVEFGHFTVRTLMLEEVSTNTVREIQHFQFKNWSDFGLPKSSKAFLYFIQCIRDSGAFDPSFGPLIVHCSAGIGRSGTFTLIESSLSQVEKGKALDVKATLLKLRKRRMMLVQNSGQFRFAYRTILEGVKQLSEGHESFLPVPPDAATVAEERARLLLQRMALSRNNELRELFEEFDDVEPRAPAEPSVIGHLLTAD